MSEELEKPKDLEFYLSDNSYNIQLQQSLELTGITKQVDFFKLFYDFLHLIESGQTLTAISHINALNSGGFELFLVYFLRERIRHDYDRPDSPPTNAMNAALHLLDGEYERLAKLFPPDPLAPAPQTMDEACLRQVGIHEFSKKMINDWVDKMMKEAEEKRNIELRAIQSERERLEKEFLSQIQNVVSASADKSKRNPEFTTNRQVIALSYLLKHLQVKNVDKTVQANFIEFLTGRNNKDIYDKVRNLDTTIYNKGGEDARYVKGWFEKLGLVEIANEIDTVLGKKSEKL